MKILKLNFIVKRNKGSDKDISITTTGEKTVYIVFRNNSDRRISRTGFITVAIFGERLYFKGTDKFLGYKIRSQKSKSTVCTSITNGDLYKWAVNHSGDYSLMLDKENKLYYVDTE